MIPSDTKSRLAQSASALGAALLGFGIGAKWGAVINSTILLVTLITGAFIHIAGMYVMQMKTAQADTFAKALWITAWICLITLIGLFIYMAVR
jgi:hypothetical protein